MLPTCAVQFDCPFIQNVWPLIEGFFAHFITCQVQSSNKSFSFLNAQFYPSFVEFELLNSS